MPPPTVEGWHPQARSWFDSLRETPQSAMYTRSDWGFAQMCAGVLSEAWRDRDWRAVQRVMEMADRRLMMTHPTRLAGRLDLEAGRDADVIELPSVEQLRERAFGAE